MVHAFALVNVLHNYDNILQQPKGYGAGITSGRWFLSVLGDFCEDILGLGYNLSTVNGLLFLAMIALSAMILVEILQIRTGVSAALLGCLMATFPTVCATMVFRYTAPYYGLSLLLSVFAARVADRGKLGMILSALCIAFSMGIYQAYVPFTIGIFLLVLMRQSLRPESTLVKLIVQGVRYCVCLVLGIVGISNPTLKNNGFEAFFFLMAMFFTISIYLKSNATDKVQDPNAVKIDLAVFRSDAAFNWGAIGVVVILTILYYALW